MYARKNKEVGKAIIGSPAVELDKMHQDEWIQLLNRITSPITVKFYDGKRISAELLSKINDPEAFLEVQEREIYGSREELAHLRKSFIEINSFKEFITSHGFVIKKKEIDEEGATYLLIERPPHAQLPLVSQMDVTELPKDTEEFYRGDVGGEYEKQKILAQHMGVPLVLNIGSGGDENRRLPHAINGDLSTVGKPQVVFDAKRLPFADNSMTMIMASHVFEHLTFSEAKEAISEWLRVLHPKGLLRIAVPDASVTLHETEEGITQKGQSAYNYPGGSAPLTQIQGLGGEHSQTHPRWRHQVLYTYELLKKMIEDESPDLELRTYSKDEALSTLSGVKLDETNRYSLMVEVRKKRVPHYSYPELRQDEYALHREEFLSKVENGLEIQPLTIVIPVRNEASNLPQFFRNFSRSLQEIVSLGIQTEVIFALNGCTDESELLIEEYIQENSQFSLKKIATPKGILSAFISGIEAKELDGHVAKIDIDTAANEWMLSWIYMYLSENPNLHVTYAEVLPLEDKPVLYSIAEMHQEFRTERVYFHGRMSMYRQNPLAHLPKELIESTGALVEDVLLSCFYAYYKGLDSMGVTPGAVVRSTTLNSYEKMYHNWVRAGNEIRKICDAFPQFEILRTIMQREPTEPSPELLHDDPFLYYIWLAYADLQGSLAKTAKAFRYLDHLDTNQDGTISTEEWSLRNTGTRRVGDFLRLVASDTLNDEQILEAVSRLQKQDKQNILSLIKHL